MRRDAGVNDASRADFHRGQNEEQLEIHGHGLEEIADNDGRGVVLDEGEPALTDISSSRPEGLQSLRDCSRRNENAELQRKLVSNPLFAPR